MNPTPGQDPTPSVAPASGSTPEQDVTRVIADVENQLLKLKEADSQRRAMSAQLEQREQELAARESQLAEAISALEAQHAKDGQLRTQLETQQAELEEHQARAAQQASELETLRAQIDEHFAQSEQRTNEIATLNTQLETLRAEQAAESHQIASRNDEIATLNDQLQTLRSEQAAAIEQSQTQLAEATEQAKQSRERTEQLSAERDQALQELRETQSRTKRLASELESAQSDQSSDARELSARVEQAAQERDHAQSELDTLRLRLEELVLERDTLAQQLAQLHLELETERKTKRAQAQAPTPRAAEARPSNGRPMPPLRVESRMRRLRGVRTALLARTRKIRRAGEVLQQRVEQCDLLLAQRRELSAAKRAVDMLHERVEVKRAKITSSIQIAAWSVTLAVLAALSWVIAGRIEPASYSATAVISAEAIGSAQGDPAAWTTFHTELLTHPRLVERVAARLHRRGMSEDATLEAVHAVLDDRLVYRDETPGTLELEVVLEGKGRAKRWMETYLTSLVAEANESRPRRRDGLSTVITQPSTVNDDPVVDPRPKYAAMGLGISSVVAALLWFGLWKTMSKVRKKYEASSRLDEILNEARWIDPVPDVARRPSRGG